MKRKYKAIFISDVHIGSSHSNVRKLLAFLKDCDADFIFLVGDTIDGLLLKSRWRWTADDNLFVQKILRKKRQGAVVVLFRGNHDEFLRAFIGMNFGGIEIAEELVYESFGKKYLIIHGDQFDGAVRFCPRLQKIGSWIYELSICVNWVLRKMGIEWSLSNYLKSKTKQAIQYLASYRETLVEYAKHKKVDGIILGHIHAPEISQIGNITYLNIGDMVESNTVLVEHTDGRFELIYLDTN